MTPVRMLLALALVAAAPVAAQTRAQPTPVLPSAAPAPAPSPAPATARPSFAVQMLAGSWALRVEGTVMFRFDLVQNGASWSGTWAKPTAFATDGAIFAELSGPPAEQRSQAGRAIGDWAELSFGDARPGAIPDVFRFRLIDPDRVEMLYADTGQAPFVLERVEPGTRPGPWAEGRVYRRPGVPAGSLISYNVGRRSAPSPAPTSAPAEGERPPAVVGR